MFKGFSKGRDVKSEVADSDIRSSGADVSVSVNNPSKKVGVGVKDLPPPPIPPSPNPVVPSGSVKSELDGKIEYFKQNYIGVFGLDSVVPSSGEVLKLNLLFSIYSELVGLRADLAEIFSKE